MENLRLGAKIGLKWVFIPFLIILVMSHNAGAIELSRDVELLRGNFQGQINVFAVPSGQVSNVSQCNLSVGSWTSAIFLGADCGVNGMALSIPQMTYNAGDWIVINLNTSYPQYSASNHMVYYGAYYSGTNPVDLLQQEVSDLNTNTGQITLYFRVYNTFTDNALNISGRSQILNANTTNSTVILRVNSVSVYRERDIPTAEENADAIADKQENATQDASDAAQDAAQDNSSNAASTNLVGVLSSFLQAITNFSATDCNVVLNFPSYAGGTMTFNVCQYKDKAGNLISVFTSLTLIVFYLPLAIKLLSMIYNEIRSFTNG